MTTGNDDGRKAMGGKRKEGAEGKAATASDVDPDRIKNPPDAQRILLAGGSQVDQGFVVKKVEMRQYVERRDEKLGDYSLLTVVVETDRGTVEMKYDEGFRGPDALDSAVKMLVQYVGLASLINRAVIELSGISGKQQQDSDGGAKGR